MSKARSARWLELGAIRRAAFAFVLATGGFLVAQESGAGKKKAKKPLALPAGVAAECDLEYARPGGHSLSLGATARDIPEKARDASALDSVSGDDPPFLIMHGSEDPGVPIEQSRKLFEKLEASGADAALHVVEGAGHGGPLFKSDEVLARVLAFFQRTLMPDRRGPERINPVTPESKQG